jgi:hypothetical protein
MTSGEMLGKLALQLHALEQRLRTPQRRRPVLLWRSLFASQILVTAQFDVQGIDPGLVCALL